MHHPATIPPRYGRGLSSEGFTLLEMVVVVLLIGMISAIALPQLMPAIVVSRFEGAARHFAGYGRSAISRAILIGEPLTVNIDLEKQEYWTIRLKTESDNQLFEDKKMTRQFSFNDEKPKSKDGEYESSFMDKLTPANIEGEPPDPSMDPRRRQFEKFIRAQLEARADRLEREGILSEIGSLFDKPFSLETDKERYEEVKEPMLERTRLPEEAELESVRVGSTTHTSGLVEIELTSMGLAEPVVAYFRSEDDEYFTVLWDPVMSTAQMERGKKDFEATHAKKPDPKDRDSYRSKRQSQSRDSLDSRKNAFQKNRENYHASQKKNNKDSNSRR